MVSDVLPENVSGLPYVSCVSDRPCSSMHLARCQLTPSVPFHPAPCSVPEERHQACVPSFKSAIKHASACSNVLARPSLLVRSTMAVGHVGRRHAPCARGRPYSTLPIRRATLMLPSCDASSLLLAGAAPSPAAGRSTSSWMRPWTALPDVRVFCK